MSWGESAREYARGNESPLLLWRVEIEAEEKKFGHVSELEGA